jgi:hypothetical protein
MTTRIGSGGPQPSIEVSATQYRVTPRPARPFSAVLDGGASAVIEGAEAAARRLPGGPEIVAAVRNPGGGRLSGQEGAAYAQHSYPMMHSGTPLTGEGGAPTSATGAEPGAGAASGSGNIEGALAKQTQDNLYYLGLQQRIQDETRNFQAISNVLKTQHESVKNAIGNLR